MNAIADAKARVIGEKNKLFTAIGAVLGSRALLAVLAMFMIAFGTQALYSPSQLPSVGGLDMVQSTLNANLDFGWLGDQVKEAAAAADRQGVTQRALDYVASHPVETNRIGFAAALLLLVGNLLIAAHKWRGATGVVIGAP